MINQESLIAVENAQFSTNFIKPLYESFCFSKIPATVSFLLTGKEKEKALPESCFSFSGDPYDVALFLFLDGFAWRWMEKHQDHPFLQRFFKEGIVSKLTAQFPSTTAAEVTTIHTGLEVGQTGIYEWFHYSPEVDRIISPLLFSYAGDAVFESLQASNIPASTFFPFKTVYQDLKKEGVTSYLIHHASLTQSPYSQTMGFDAHSLSYFTLRQGVQNVKELLENAQEPMYAMLYFADIDSVGHRKGVNSSEIEKEIIATLNILEEKLQSVLSCQNKKIACLCSADHGMSPIDPAKTIYVNQVFDQLPCFYKKGRDGRPLAPAGSCRDFFLHIEAPYVDKVIAELSRILKGKADVKKTSELISLGFFGGSVSSRLLQRVGNIVILPYLGESVWWWEKHRFEQHFYGAHGGLTREEMEIPFLFYKNK